ncbi:MAG: cell division protein ZapA [Rickettsiaceae bacterium]|nr:cell division protein ZapA [Rickettsiaceae bacterium]MDP4832421.1 cell division protein ZapA [Rickettsiaceae bacterium]MDP5020150.1 cell division protein ZapA [Rickettsiaceae bacterium]MDP5082752.1 cell division protein ZapA [Rickettsiaceae bacterium]
MSIVTITLNNKQFKLSCPEESKDKLESLADKLDCAIQDTKSSNPAASFELALIITALGLINDTTSQEQKTGGEVLEKANADFQKLLSSLSLELKTVAKKIENC